MHPVFLVHDETERLANSPYFPLGLLYLASYARDHGHEVSVFDATFAAGHDDFVAHLTEHQPDIVGISALVTSRDAALALAEIARTSETIVVLGGPDPTTNPAPYLAHEAVDLVVHHEGEQTIVALLDRIDAGTFTPDALADELGIAFRRDGRTHINQPRPPIEDLDELPTPARDLIDMEKYLNVWETGRGYTSVTVSATRGCPFGCEWCEDAVHGTDFRQRSPESIAAEVNEIVERYQPESIRLVDDITGIDPSWFDAWSSEADRLKTDVSFEPLDRVAIDNLPLLEVRDCL